MRAFLSTATKLALVAGLIYWLMATGKLDFGALKVLVQDSEILVANCAIWLFIYVGLGTLRWFALLRGLGLKVGFGRALHLQLIGFFFNTAIPGAVGGDIVKAVYVIREQQAQAKTPAMLTVLLDRVLGLAGLFVLAGIAVAFNLDVLRQVPRLWPLVAFLAVGLVGLIIGFAVVMYPFPPGRDPFVRLLSKGIPGFAQLRKIYEALRDYRNSPKTLVFAVGLSVVIQAFAITYAYVLTQRLTGQSPPIGVFGTIFPIGIMVTAVPLAPGGLGVGHVAFDQLFTMAGLTGGATVFNVIVLGQLSLNLLGFIPYLLHRTRLPAGAALEAELKSTV
jgi:uncharacterized membrane protein YbhN (UPF0104 family)